MGLAIVKEVIYASESGCSTQQKRSRSLQAHSRRQIVGIPRRGFQNLEYPCWIYYGVH